MLRLSVIFLSFLLVFIPSASYAEKILFLTPTRVNLNDEDRVEVINVTNLSDLGRAYKISFQDLIMTRDGITTPVDNFDFSAKRMLRFAPREFVLKPGEQQTIRIMSRVRPNTEPGDYHTHIRFLEDVTKRAEINPPQDGDTASIEAPLAYEALIPAVVSHGNTGSNIDISSATLGKNPKTGNTELSLIVTREGNGQAIAYIDTEYVNPDGSTEIASPRRTVYIYRELDERTKIYDLQPLESGKAEGKLKISLYNDPGKQAPLLKEITLPLP